MFISTIAETETLSKTAKLTPMGKSSLPPIRDDIYKRWVFTF